MPDGMGGAGIGAGGGAAAATIVYALDRIFGSGKAARNLEERIREFRENVEREIKEMRSVVERAAGISDKLFDWHNIADPDDPSGKLWYFSVALRRAIESLQAKTQRLLDLLDQLVRRFDQYNTTTERLIIVVESLQRDVSALGILVSGMDRRRP
jgi:hypothetical protein